MHPFISLFLTLATLPAFATFAPLLAQAPLPGPTFDKRDIRVVARGEKPSSLGSKLAVVVGINRYAKLPALAYAEKDAKDLATRLPCAAVRVVRAAVGSVPATTG